MRLSLAILGILNSAFSPICHGSPVRIGVTGDVNLNPFLYKTHPAAYEYPWGSTLQTVQALDAFFVNHEATIANVVDAQPNNFQMEDPVNFTQTFVEAGVDAIVLANNHQFDYNRSKSAQSLPAVRTLTSHRSFTLQLYVQAAHVLPRVPVLAFLLFASSWRARDP